MNVALDRSEQPHTRRGLVSVLDLPLTRSPRPREVFSRLHLRPPSPRRGTGGKGQHVGKLDRSVNFVATK